MKKLLAILLALMLVMVSVAALATDPIDDGGDTNTPAGDTGNGDNTGDTAGGTSEAGDLTPYLPTDDQKPSIDPAASTYTITKAINIYNDFGDAVIPADAEFSFDVKNGTTTATNSDGTAIDMTTLIPTIANTDLNEGTDTVTLTLTLPDYPVPGIYEYEIEEKSSDLAGMTYAEDLALKITVIWNQTDKKLEVAGIAIRQSDVKVDEIENEYAAGNLKVTKTVKGNFGDVNKKFPIKIEFEADRKVGSTSTYTYNGVEKTVAWNDKTATVEVDLKSGESIEIKNLPDGVTYKITEGVTEANRLDDSTEKPENPEAYKVEGEVTSATDVPAGDKAEEEIINTKDIEPDTGIVLDSLPYVLLMVLAAAGFAMMNARKREDY